MLTVRGKFGSSKPFEILIDGGAQLNLLSPIKAKEWDLKLEPLPGVEVKGVGSDVPIYGYTKVKITIQDSRGRVQEQEIPFVVADTPRYPVYLGLPYIDQYRPKLNYFGRRMLFRGIKVKDEPTQGQIAFVCANELANIALQPGTELYVASVTLVEQEGTENNEILQLPPEYSDYTDVASEDNHRNLAEHGPSDLAINLQEGSSPPHMPLYSMTQSELQQLRKQLDEYLQKGWIRHSRSSAGAPILFAKKKDGRLRLCVDYRGLNKITLKNSHPLPLINESLELLKDARYFTKLDVREAYHRIRIKEGDEWKTAFRTRYGLYEYLVMPFGLTNAPAQFQAHIHQVLAGLVDTVCIVYLDDILVFSKTKEDHVKHVRQVLDRLRKARLYLHLKKCEFHTQQTEYLGFIVSNKGISVDPKRIKTIQDWPEPRSVHDIRVFIGFLNYYRRFIHHFSRIALPLTVLTRKGPECAKRGHKLRKEESQHLDIGPDGKAAFEKLKDSFLGVPILSHFDWSRATKVEVDASGGGLGAILSQLVQEADRTWIWRPIDFFSRKLRGSEINYDTHDQELLAIVESLEHWRKYLDKIPFDLFTDHHNLLWFMETKTLNSRQVRSYLKLTAYDFIIKHRSGVKNPADGPSRRPDYMAEAGAEKEDIKMRCTVPLRHILSRKDREQPIPLVSAVTHAQASQLAPDPDDLADPEEFSDDSVTDEEIPEKTADDSPLVEPVSQPSQEVLVSSEQKAEALRRAHDHPFSGHFGYKKTLERVLRQCWWEGVRKDVQDYCRDCMWCRRSVAARHRPYGLLQPLPIPKYPWEQVTFDFITELPPSKLMGQVFDAVLVVVDRLTKMCHYVPAKSNWTAEALGEVWMREVVRLHGTPALIISDRGPLMNSKYWDTFTHYLSSVRVMSTAFHPQTDGQTERQNQTLEQYLRCYCCLEQDDWASWLSVAEFAYNDSVNTTTGVSPFRAYHGADPRGPNWPGQPLGEGESALAAGVAAKALALQQECRRKIAVANAYQKKYADRKRMHANFAVGDQVLVSNRHMKTTRPKKKLDWKYVGPGRIVAQYGTSAYKVDLPNVKGVHPVFHASLLEPYSPTGSIPHPNTPIVDTLQALGDDVYDVERIVDRRQNSVGVWEYLVKWHGYSEEENSWEPGPNISGNALKEFWKKHKVLPKRVRHGDPGQAPKKRRGRPPKNPKS